MGTLRRLITKGSAPVWASWAWGSRIAWTWAARSTRELMLGVTRSTPSMSSLGDIKPASTTRMRPSYSSATRVSPISPRPPRGMTLRRLTSARLEERQLLLGVGFRRRLSGAAPRLDHVDVTAHLLEVGLEGVHQEPAVQRRGRMVKRHVGPIAPFHQLSVDSGCAVVPGQQPLPSVAAQQQDHGRTDELDLAVQVRRARGHLLGQGVAVAGGPAFDDVGDVDLVAVDADVAEQLVQQLPRRAHEQLNLEVLVLPGRLTNDHDPGVSAPNSRHRLGPGQMQRAEGALSDLPMKDLQRLAQAGAGASGRWMPLPAGSGPGRQAPGRPQPATASERRSSRPCPAAAACRRPQSRST